MRTKTKSPSAAKPTGAASDRKSRPTAAARPAVPAFQRQASPAGGVVQRAIGFEFETNAKLKSDKLPYKHPLYNHKWDGKSVTQYGSGWNAHVDGGKVEFATQPVEKEEDLKEQLGNMIGVAEKMESCLLEKKAGVVEVKEAFGVGDTTDELVTKNGSRGLYSEGIYADIQNTVSIELAKVPHFYSKMAGSATVRSFTNEPSHGIYRPFHLSNEKALKLPAPEAIAEQQVSNLQTTVDIAGYKGVLTMVVDYLNGFVISNANSSVSDYVKSDFPLLQRVNFVKMFRSLGADDEWQKVIGDTLPQMVALWASEILSMNPTSSFLASLKRSYAIFVKNKDMEKFLESIPTAKRSEGMIRKEVQLPSVGGWLRGMRESKKDLLSSVDNPIHDSTSMGNLDMDAVGEVPKAIFENRSLMTRGLIGGWEKIAMTVFKDYKTKI